MMTKAHYTMRLKEALSILRQKSFYRLLFLVALPICVQQLITSTLNIVDTIMVGALGDLAISAVGIGNQYFFLQSMLLMGLFSGISVFTAQFHGNKDTKNVRSTMALGLLSGMVIALLFMVAGLVLTPQIIHLFTGDATLIDLGSDYLRMAVWSYPFMAVSFAHMYAMRSMQVVRPQVIISLVAIIINIVFNYILIFGLFGFPAMGVVGSALGTLIARVVEMICYILFTRRYFTVLRLKLKDLFTFNRELLRHVFAKTAPVVVHEGAWGLGTTVVMMIYGSLGVAALTAVQISNTVNQIFMVILFSVSSSTAVILGNKLGAGKREETINYGYALIGFVTILGLFMGATIIVLAPNFLNLFTVSDEVRNLATQVLVVMGCVAVFRVITATLIVGIFRAGGDTKYAMFLEMATLWGWGIPVGFLAATIFHAPLVIVVMIVMSEEVIKAVLGVRRMLKERWANNLVDQYAKE